MDVSRHASCPLTPTYLSQGVLATLAEYAEARPLYEHARKIYEGVFGPKHPIIVHSLNALAMMHIELGEHKEAHSLYDRSLVIVRQTLGFDHPSTVESLIALASLLDILGQYGEARALYEQALTIVQQKFGPDHPVMADCLRSIGNCVARQKDDTEAYSLYEHADAIYERAFSPMHPKVAVNLTGQASLAEKRLQYEQAIDLLNRALTIYAQRLGNNHPLTIEVRLNIATTQGLDLFRKVWYRKVVPPVGVVMLLFLVTGLTQIGILFCLCMWVLVGVELWRLCWGGAVLFDLGTPPDWSIATRSTRLLGVVSTVLGVGDLLVDRHTLVGLFGLGLGILGLLIGFAHRAQIRERGITTYLQFVSWKKIDSYIIGEDSFVLRMQDHSNWSIWTKCKFPATNKKIILHLLIQNIDKRRTDTQI